MNTNRKLVAIIYDDVLEACGGDMRQAALAEWISHFSQGRTKQSKVGEVTLTRLEAARILRCSEDQARTAIDGLVKIGLIEKRATSSFQKGKHTVISWCGYPIGEESPMHESLRGKIPDVYSGKNPRSTITPNSIPTPSEPDEGSLRSERPDRPPKDRWGNPTNKHPETPKSSEPSKLNKSSAVSVIDQIVTITGRSVSRPAEVLESIGNATDAEIKTALEDLSQWAATGKPIKQPGKAFTFKLRKLLADRDVETARLAQRQANFERNKATEEAGRIAADAKAERYAAKCKARNLEVKARVQSGEIGLEDGVDEIAKNGDEYKREILRKILRGDADALY